MPIFAFAIAKMGLQIALSTPLMNTNAAQAAPSAAICGRKCSRSQSSAPVWKNGQVSSHSHTVQSNRDSIPRDQSPAAVCQLTCFIRLLAEHGTAAIDVWECMSNWASCFSIRVSGLIPSWQTLREDNYLTDITSCYESAEIPRVYDIGKIAGL